MSSSREEVLTSDELRKRLYQTFKNKGVLDTLKVQLRNQLIQELKHPPLPGQEPVPRPVEGKSEPLLVSACNSIVAEHLRISGYEYTLSIFYPESGLCKDKVFKTEDLLQFLRITPESSLFTSLSSTRENRDKGFLTSLLTNIAKHHDPSLRHDADTQTTSLSYGESLVDKMKMIDKEYDHFIYNKDKMFSFQSQLAAYRKETQTQMEAEMNTKMQHFRDVEVAKVRMDEKTKFHKEFEKLKQELEQTYGMKTKALTDREKNAIERLQKQQEIEEKNVYMQRQSVLKEIETLRNRENELKLRMEEFEKTRHIHEEKVKTAEELMRRRELAVKTLEDTHDQRLKNELSRYQSELKEDFSKRTEKLTESENRNKLETARILKESAVIDANLEEHRRVCSELKRLQNELDTAQQQTSLLTQQNELLRERLENVSDYPVLKREKAEVEGQLRLLKKQLDEAQEENQFLRADLSRPSKEQLFLQMELRRLQSARKLDEEEFENQKQVLQAQLQSEVERCAQLRAQLTECEKNSEWMKNYAEEIKTQLRQTQQALEVEVLRSPKLSLVDRSLLELSADKLVTPNVYVDRALLRTRVGYNAVCEAGASFQRHTSPWSNSHDSDLELVAEAKARIQELQKEAEVLEDAYRNYQQRAVYSTISHMLPQKPLSPQQACPSAQPDSFMRKQDSHHLYSLTVNKPKTLRRPLSPSNQAPPKGSYGVRSTLTPAKVNFSEEQDQVKELAFTDHSLRSITEPLFMKQGERQDESKYQPSILHPFYEKNLQKELQEAEAVVSPATSPQLVPDRQLSSAPLNEVMTSGDFSSELSPPRSPQLKSTTRDQPSLAKPQPVFTSSESSPQPERISLQDLTGISEPGHIPELLLDTAVPLSEEAPDGPAAPHPQDLPEDPVHSHSQAEVVPPSEEPASLEEVEDEELKWERERKERQEQRQREQEEARLRELQELERLEKEMSWQEAEQPAEDEEETEAQKRTDEEQKQETDDEKEESKSENPLEKYMKMVLEAREKKGAHSPSREEAVLTSPEARSISEEKNDSIGVVSNKEDDFW